MAGKLTKRGAALSLDYISGRAFQKTATHSTYLALLTVVPPDDTVTPVSMTEVTTAGYARVAVTWAAPAIVNGAELATNSGTITFGPISAVGGMTLPAVAAALVQNASGTAGDALMYWIFDIPLQAAQGESLQLAAGDLDMFLN